MTALCDYMSAAKAARPPEIAEHAKHHILDTLAAMISGSELPPEKRRNATSAPMPRRATRRSPAPR